MTKPTFPTREAARKAGWYSRRHQTNEANTEARLNYRATRGKESRQERAKALHARAKAAA